MADPKNILDFPEFDQKKSTFLKGLKKGEFFNGLKKKLLGVVVQRNLLVLSLFMAILNLYLFMTPNQNLEQIKMLTILEMLILPLTSIVIARPCYFIFFSKYEEEATISWIIILFYLGAVTSILIWILV